MPISSAAVSSFAGSPLDTVVAGGTRPQVESQVGPAHRWRWGKPLVPVERVLILKSLYCLYLL